MIPSDMPPSRKSLVMRCWRGAFGYWRGPTAPIAWLLFAVSAVSIILQLVVQYRLNFWSRDLFNAIEQKNASALIDQAMARAEYLEAPRRLTFDLLEAACISYFVDDTEHVPVYA